MADWALIASSINFGGERHAGEPDEANVPFVMRLDNDGLRIISKMRRINYMVRTERTFTAWRKYYKVRKASARCEYFRPLPQEPNATKHATTHTQALTASMLGSA